MTRGGAAGGATREGSPERRSGRPVGASPPMPGTAGPGRIVAGRRGHAAGSPPAPLAPPARRHPDHADCADHADHADHADDPGRCRMPEGRAPSGGLTFVGNATVILAAPASPCSPTPTSCTPASGRPWATGWSRSGCATPRSRWTRCRRWTPWSLAPARRPLRPGRPTRPGEEPAGGHHPARRPRPAVVGLRARPRDAHLGAVVGAQRRGGAALPPLRARLRRLSARHRAAECAPGRSTRPGGVRHCRGARTTWCWRPPAADWTFCARARAAGFPRPGRVSAVTGGAPEDGSAQGKDREGAELPRVGWGVSLAGARVMCHPRQIPEGTGRRRGHRAPERGALACLGSRHRQLAVRVTLTPRPGSGHQGSPPPLVKQRLHAR